MIEVKYATKENVSEYYNGGYPYKTFRGVAVIEDGKTIILGGIYRDRANHIAFSDFKVDPTKYRRYVIKATQMVMEMIHEYHHVYAVIGKNSPPGAREYIEHYGFVENPLVGRNDVFIWRKDNGNDG